MNKLSIERRAQIIACLVEGNSVRATCRLTHSSKDAVLKLVADPAEACLEYQREHLRDLACRRIQCDEIWSFVYAKAKNVPGMMIHGRDDGCIGAETLDGMEKLFPKGLKIELVPGAGHFVHQERPDHVNQLVLKFLKSPS